MHEDAIQDLQLSPDGSYAVSASLDKTAKLVDIETFQVLKTYRTGRLVQSAAISPIFDHVSGLRGCASHLNWPHCIHNDLEAHLRSYGHR